jgi:hypothetical protein
MWRICDEKRGRKGWESSSKKGEARREKRRKEGRSAYPEDQERRELFNPLGEVHAHHRGRQPRRAAKRLRLGFGVQFDLRLADPGGSEKNDGLTPHERLEGARSWTTCAVSRT